MPKAARNQPTGEPVSSCETASPSPRTSVNGLLCRIEPINIDRHGHQPFAAFHMDGASKDKGRNRDTAWYSILDREYSALESAFSNWLDPDNFDQRGQQKIGLGVLIEAAWKPAGSGP